MMTWERGTRTLDLSLASHHDTLGGGWGGRGRTKEGRGGWPLPCHPMPVAPPGWVDASLCCMNWSPQPSFSSNAWLTKIFWLSVFVVKVVSRLLNHRHFSTLHVFNSLQDSCLKVYPIDMIWVHSVLTLMSSMTSSRFSPLLNWE